MFSPYLPA
ncbi:hypothetical protein ECEC1863_2836, partial [Escherichia coli EC1863]